MKMVSDPVVPEARQSNKWCPGKAAGSTSSKVEVPPDEFSATLKAKQSHPSREANKNTLKRVWRCVAIKPSQKKQKKKLGGLLIDVFGLFFLNFSRVLAFGGVS